MLTLPCSAADIHNGCLMMEPKLCPSGSQFVAGNNRGRNCDKPDGYSSSSCPYVGQCSSSEYMCSTEENSSKVTCTRSGSSPIVFLPISTQTSLDLSPITAAGTIGAFIAKGGNGYCSYQRGFTGVYKTPGQCALSHADFCFTPGRVTPPPTGARLQGLSGKGRGLKNWV